MIESADQGMIESADQGMIESADQGTEQWWQGIMHSNFTVMSISEYNNNIFFFITLKQIVPFSDWLRVPVTMHPISWRKKVPGHLEVPEEYNRLAEMEYKLSSNYSCRRTGRLRVMVTMSLMPEETMLTVYII
jgi:hypothetical protein